MHTTRRVAISGLAAIAITGGGFAAYAATASSSPSATPSYGYSGEGPMGGMPSGVNPSGVKPPTPGPHLDGTVVSSSATKIIITDRDGFQRTIDISSSTKFTDGITASVAKGTKISAAGKVDADKTSLDATTVGKMPTPPAGGPGMGGPGRSGPGRGGLGEGAPGNPGARPAGTPPSGAPSAAPTA